MSLQMTEVDPADEWQEFDHAGQRWSFNGDELALLNEDGEFHFEAYHLLVKPTIESVAAFIDAQILGNQNA